MKIKNQNGYPGGIGWNATGR